MPILVTCRVCDRPFQRTLDHEGFANVCPECGDGDVDRVMGKVAWSGKHTMELEITSNRAEAIRFNGLQKRFGAGVTKSLVAGREPASGRECRKDGTGAELGAIYHSPLGEKRVVKR